MFSGRLAWQRYRLLARKAAYGLPRDVLQRKMSTIPGGSGENILYAVLCGGAFVGSLTYACRGLYADQARFNERLDQMNARPKMEWVPKPWPPKSGEEEEAAAQAPGGVDEDGEEEAAAAAAAETAVEAGTDVVAEAAPAVEKTGEDVVEAVEDTTQPAAEPAAEPESNGMASSEEAAAASEA